MDISLPTSQRRSSLGGNMDTSWLKIVALGFMMIDHLGVAVFGSIPEMRMLGRIAFPLYAWCLVAGCEYTHSLVNYALRLLVLAIISQPINMIALDNPWSKLNILFLLCLGVIAIGGIQKKWYGSQFWAPLLCYVFLGYVQVDYGWKGLTFILLLYAARKSRGGLAAVFLAYAMFWGTSSSQVSVIAGVPLTFLAWPGIGNLLQPFFRIQGMVWMALPFLLIQSHVHPKLPKWLGYGLYPLHLLLIIAFQMLLGVPLADMLIALGNWS